MSGAIDWDVIAPPRPDFSFVNRPCAAPGLISYRAHGRYGLIMIGAKDDTDAMREARRSSSVIHSLERWDGAAYAPVTGEA